MKRITQFLYGSGLLLFGLVSCNTLDPIPTDDFTDANFWQSSANAEQMVNLAYSQMYSADKMFNDEALSDNIYEGRSNTDQRIIRNGMPLPTLGRFESEWREAYGGLKTCHVFLANIDRVPDATDAWKNRKIAEMRFVRAMIYFRLVNFYGDVPFFDRDITQEESEQIPRTPKAEILAFIHSELSAISPLLPTRDELDVVDRGRITRGAVMAFQARAYLYESNWQRVTDYCDSLMNHQGTYGSYALFSDYEGLFQIENEYNQEVILDYSYIPSVRMWGKLYFAAPRSAGAPINDYAPLQSLADNYITLSGESINNNPDYNENNPYVNRDPRMGATIVFHGGQWTNRDGSKRTIYIRPGTGSTDEERMDRFTNTTSNETPTGYYLKKYYDRTSTEVFQSGLNIIMFRYADVLLMYAEAKEQLGQLDATVWNQTIRPIRERAGFEAAGALNMPTNTGGISMTTLIRNERRSELAMEGLRYFDIIRWKAGKTYLDGPVFGARFANNNSAYIRLDTRRFDENRDYLFSLPQSQTDLNKNLLPNNPGHAN